MGFPENKGILGFSSHNKIKSRKPWAYGFSFDISLLLQTELLVELVNTSAAVDKLLLTCEERVAFRADFHFNILLGGTGFDYVSACALNSGGLIIGMDSFFHYVTAFSLSISA